VVRLAVAQSNQAAVEFYRRNGFRYTGEPAGLMPDGIRREDIMAKALPE
jgi:ribosomal protein S18 acetylase RimI-like enzyme